MHNSFPSYGNQNGQTSFMKDLQTRTSNKMYPRYEDLDNSITIRGSVRKSGFPNV